MSALRFTREAAIQMKDSVWKVIVQREPDGTITVGLMYGDKAYLSHNASLTADEFGELLTEVGINV